MITVVGSLNIDLISTVDRFPKPGETLIGSEFRTSFGGKGANQAVAAARLGGTVQMIGCVGDDPFGHEYLTYLKKEGILVDRVKPVTHVSTGTAHIVLAQGENSIIVVPGANFQLAPEDIDRMKDALEKSDIILMQLETRLDTVERVLFWAERFGIRTILNPAPFQPIPDGWWEMITYLTPNEHEAEALMKSATFKEEFLEKLIITLGKKGAVYHEKGRKIEIPAPQVDAADTTGAGDTFNGALAHFLSEGLSLGEACRYAVHAASLSVTKPGAQGGMPTRAQLESFMNGR